MALDKLVDSAQLDSDLEDVADAIRAKSGGNGTLSFPSGFISEIGNIATGSSIKAEFVTVTVATDKTSEYNILTGNQFLADNYADSGFFCFVVALDNITTSDSVLVNMASNTQFANTSSYGFGLRTYNGGLAVVPVSKSFASQTAVYNGCTYYANGSLKVNATSTRVLRAGNYAIIMGVIE